MAEIAPAGPVQPEPAVGCAALWPALPLERRVAVIAVLFSAVFQCLTLRMDASAAAPIEHPRRDMATLVAAHLVALLLGLWVPAPVWTKYR